jgi:hypothetical protein
MEITTTFGASQVRDWSYTNLQQRFRHKKFFAQLFYNNSNSGNADAADANGTYYLRTGIPVVDKSSVLVGSCSRASSSGARASWSGASSSVPVRRPRGRSTAATIPTTTSTRSAATCRRRPRSRRSLTCCWRRAAT